jgi:hypothetical protein
MILEKIKCTKCKGEMPKLRLTSYGYDFCIECSDVMPKVGRIRVVGEGDYTATELDVVDQDTAKRLQELENNSRGVRNTPLEILNFDEDEMSDSIVLIEAATVVALDDSLELETIDDLEEDGVLEEVEDLELDDDDE